MIEEALKIPQNWMITSVGDVYNIIGGGTPSTSVSDYWEGKIPWITSADIHGVRDIEVSRYVSEQGVQNSATNKVPPKTLLVVTRVGLGKIAIAECEMCFSQDLQGLVQSPDFIWPEYALYYLSYELQKLKYEGRGTTISGITKKQLKDTQFPLPPLNEQKRIVAKIDELFSELDKGIESLKTAREQLKVYRQAVLKHAFEGKLTADWREKNCNIKEFKNFIFGNEVKDFSELPKGWLYTQLGKVIEEPKYGTSKKCDYDINGIGVLRIPNIVSGIIDSTDLKFANFDADEINTYRLIRGDMLIIRSNGSVSIVGKCALVKEQDEKFLYAGYLIRLRLNREFICPEFLNYVLSSHLLRTQIEHKAKSTSGVNNINAGELKSLIIPICGTEEQEEVVKLLKEKLSTIDHLEETIEQNLQKSDALRQSILKKAFSGKLVAQDPNDEPASVLLERIRAEKEAQSGKKKPKQEQGADSILELAAIQTGVVQTSFF